MRRLIDELRRRGVLRMGVGYLATAWLLVQLFETLFPIFGLPETRVRWIVIALVIGFLPALLLSWAFEWTREGIRTETYAAQHPEVRPRNLDRVVIAILAAAVTYFAIDKFLLRERAPAEPVAVSVAVLPFADMSEHRDATWFADGMSEELLNLLAQIPDLRVASRTSSFSFRGKDVQIADVAEALRVTHVLEGSVRRSGDRLRVTAQLISAADGYHVFSQNYDSHERDLLAIQDDIARRIVEALKVRVLGDLPRVEQTDPRAHVLYLQAQELQQRRTEADMARAVALLKEVLAIDPGYVKAWIALSVTYSNQAAAGIVPPEQGYVLSREAALQALRLDPLSAQGYERLSWIARVYDANLASAAEYCAKALALEPANEATLSHAAVLLQSLGRLDEAIALHEYSAARAPSDPTAHHNLALAYYFADRLDDAERTMRKVLAISPHYLGAYYRLGTILLLRGDFAGARDAFANEDDEAFRVKGRALVASGLRDETAAKSALAELGRRWGERWPSEVAHVHAYRRDLDAAFEWLERDYVVAGPAGWGEWRRMRLLDNLHDDPRWQAFLEKVGASDAQLAAIRFEARVPGY